MGPAALRDGGCERRTAVSASQLKRIGQLRIYISYDSHIVVAERIRLESDPKSRAQLGMEESPSSEDGGGKSQFEGLRILLDDRHQAIDSSLQLPH